MPERIDGRRALELLTDVVDVFGEGFLYEPVPISSGSDMIQCVYWNGGPSCIVGHVLDRAGYSGNVIHWLDTTVCSPGRFRSAGLDVTEEAGQVLAAAQIAQDSGKTWGEALEAARETYEEMA